MTVNELVKLMKPENEFSIYRRVRGRYIDSHTKQPISADDQFDKLVFFGSKEDFLDKNFTMMEKKVGNDFAEVMRKDREIVKSFEVEEIDFDNAGIYVNDPEKRLVSIQ